MVTVLMTRLRIEDAIKENMNWLNKTDPLQQFVSWKGRQIVNAIDPVSLTNGYGIHLDPQPVSLHLRISLSPTVHFFMKWYNVMNCPPLTSFLPTLTRSNDLTVTNVYNITSQVKLTYQQHKYLIIN